MTALNLLFAAAVAADTARSTEYFDRYREIMSLAPAAARSVTFNELRSVLADVKMQGW